MAWFSFVAENNIIVKDFCDEVRIRLFKSDIIKSPFSGNVFLKKDNNKYKGFVSINHKYPSLDVFWFIGSFLVFVFSGFRFTTFSGLLMFIGVFFSLFRFGFFYFILFFFGLRKKGYKGKFYPVLRGASWVQ
jgi:hypothetical protein